ncbi:MAG: sulfurtransferase, partial [Burkholderiaceae bacterium]
MPATATPYVNIAAYKFVALNDTAEKRPQFLQLCEQLQLKGTILLSPEGINLFLAGLREPIDRFLVWLRDDPRFADLEVKESYSATQPFGRMLVKLKA